MSVSCRVVMGLQRILYYFQICLNLSVREVQVFTSKSFMKLTGMAVLCVLSCFSCSRSARCS